MAESVPYKQAEEQYQRTRISHWDSIAQKRDSWRSAGRWYHRRLQEVYAYLIPPEESSLYSRSKYSKSAAAQVTCWLL